MKIVLVLFFLAMNVQAADIGLSVRAAGMGNAYTAIVDNGDSIFYNPAGLAKMSGFNWTIMDSAMGVNKIDSYQDYVDLFSDSNNEVDDIIAELYGESLTLYGGGKSLFSIGGLSFGIYGVADANFLVNNPAFPNIETTYRLDYGLVAGWGMELVPQMLDIGLQTRRVTRQGGSLPIGVATIATLDSQTIENEINQLGTGYAFDLGMNLTFPGALAPTVSFAWRDVGDTAFRPNTTGGSVPDPVKAEQVIGLGFNWGSTLMDIKTAIDYRFLNDSSQQIGKKLNIGMEFNWPILDIRAGLHQGYYTLGTSFDLWMFRVDIATYGVELGEYPGQLEDRRHMIQFTFEFGIDPGSFNLFKLNRPAANKRHKRKLRR